jgi:hypothetical protein
MRICLWQQRKEEFKGSHNAAENSQAWSKLKILLVQCEMLPGGSVRMLDILQITLGTRFVENPFSRKFSQGGRSSEL